MLSLRKHSKIKLHRVNMKRGISFHFHLRTEQSSAAPEVGYQKRTKKRHLESNGKASDTQEVLPSHTPKG